MNPLVLLVLVLVLIFTLAGIVLFALARKGDVFAAFSLRPFKFTLRAKDRKPTRPPANVAN